jgi:hypothetical protein
MRHEHHLLREDSYQMVLHRPVEPAPVYQNLIAFAAYGMERERTLSVALVYPW